MCICYFCALNSGVCLNVEAPPPRPDQCELCGLCEPLAGGALTSQRPDLQCEETAPAAVCRAGGDAAAA